MEARSTGAQATKRELARPAGHHPVAWGRDIDPQYRRTPVSDPADPLVDRHDHETPRILNELANAARRTRRPVRTGAEPLGARLPIELDQLGRIVGHLDQSIGESLL